MFGGYRVVSVTPAGRRKYLQTLLPYLAREADLIDEHEWWVNTDIADDIDYMHRLSAERPGFFKLVEVDAPHAAGPKERNERIANFYSRCVDSNTIYIKLDDDICYMAPGAVQELLHFRLENPAYFLTYANTINSPLNTHIHQRIGALPVRCGSVDYDPFGNALHEPHIAALAHETFLRDIEESNTRRWQFERWEMPRPERFSINFCAWFGSDFGLFGGQVEGDDEEFLACEVPRRLARTNAVCGRSLVSHFAFCPQCEALEKSGLLEQYHQLSTVL